MNVKKIRLKLMLTQQQLADKLSVTKTTVSRWENDRVLPSELNQIKLFNLVGGDTD